MKLDDSEKDHYREREASENVKEDRSAGVRIGMYQPVTNLVMSQSGRDGSV